MIPKSSTDKRRAGVGGIVSGFLAGLLLSAVMTAMTLAHGGDPWMGLKGASAPFLGARAMQPGFDLLAVWLGLVCHFAVSIAWGLGFAFLFYGLSRVATLVAGAAWGIVVWLGMYYVVLPIVGLSAVAHTVPIAMAVGMHVFFGLCVATVFLGYQREESRWLMRWRPAHAL